MVKTCCVYKCNNHLNASAKSKGISFFRFPTDKRKRRAWIKAVNRDEWTPNDHSCLCSEHFVQGWYGDDPEDENYAPTLFSYKQSVVIKEREQRIGWRENCARYFQKYNQLCTHTQAYISAVWSPVTHACIIWVTDSWVLGVCVGGGGANHLSWVLKFNIITFIQVCCIFPILNKMSP